MAVPADVLVVERPYDAPLYLQLLMAISVKVASRARPGPVVLVVRRVRVVGCESGGPEPRLPRLPGAGGGLQAVALVVPGGGRWRLRVLLSECTGMADVASARSLRLVAPARRAAAAARRARQAARKRGSWRCRRRAEEAVRSGRDCGYPLPPPPGRAGGGGAAVAPEVLAAAAARPLVREGGAGCGRGAKGAHGLSWPAAAGNAGARSAIGGGCPRRSRAGNRNGVSMLRAVVPQETRRCTLRNGVMVVERRPCCWCGRPMPAPVESGGGVRRPGAPKTMGMTSPAGTSFD